MVLQDAIEYRNCFRTAFFATHACILNEVSKCLICGMSSVRNVWNWSTQLTTNNKAGMTIYPIPLTEGTASIMNKFDLLIVSKFTFSHLLFEMSMITTGVCLALFSEMMSHLIYVCYIRNGRLIQPYSVCKRWCFLPFLVLVTVDEKMLKHNFI